MNQQQQEKVGEEFSREDFFKARDLTKKIVHDVFKKCRVGMYDKEIVEMLDAEMFKCGADRLWHPTKVRIGAETLKNFPDSFNPDRKLLEGDILFFDVGPVFYDHEGDYGETFVFGKSDQPCKKAVIDFSKELFHKLSNEWKSQKLTGVQLYEKAVAYSLSAGFEFNLRMGGHRLGDFPHALFSKSKLKDIDFVPADDLWILEVHVLDRDNQIGAFYEDLLS